jgi:hypothetical protein
MEDEMTGIDWHWFIRSTHMGTSPVQVHYVFSRPYVPQSQLFICNTCGEIWARIIRENADAWHIEARQCDRCGPGFALPYDPQWIHSAPLSILRREVLLISELPDPTTYDSKLIFRNTL